MKIYSEYSQWWLVVIAVSAAGIAYLQYHFKLRTRLFPTSIKLFLSILRFSLLFIIGILLLDFYSRFVKQNYIKPTLVIAVDNSQSMISARDSQEVKNFFQKQFSEYLNQWRDKFDVQVLTFGEKNNFNPDSISFKEYKTNAENVFYQAQQILGNKSINAMIMISDGIFNEGVHPVSLTDNINYPVYVLATGDTNIYKDISIKKILHNKNVFIGNDFIVEILLSANAIQNEKVKVSINENNKEIVSKELSIHATTQSVINVPFQIQAKEGGYHTYKVIVSHVKDEKNTQNNIAYFVINVIENKIKVLFLYTAPHPDISAIRDALRQSEQYETDAYMESDWNKNLNNYDVVVYHSPDMNSTLYNQCIKNQIPMFIITTNLSVLQNKFLQIKQYLPQQSNEIEANVNTSFSAFSLNDEYKELSSQLPIILAPYGDYQPIGEYNILFYQVINDVITDLPLFYFTQTTQSKYAIFLGDGLWRWKMLNYQTKQNTQWFQHLIHQSIRYLSIKRDKSPFKVHIPAAINENEPLQVTAELYNETMQPITEPDVFLKLENNQKKEYKYVFNKSNNNYFLNAEILPAGEYKYTAYTQYRGKEYTQKGKLHIVPVSIEKNNLNAQHSLLKLLSQKTSGQFYPLSQINELSKSIQTKEDFKTIVTEQESYQYWIDNKIWFIILIGFATLEWFIRRWNGII